MDIEIRDVNINSLNVPEVPEWLMDPPQALPPEVPVTQQIGIPIIDIPGCVEAHEQADEKNQSITGDDPKGVRVYCDGMFHHSIHLIMNQIRLFQSDPQQSRQNNQTTKSRHLLLQKSLRK